MNGIFSFELGKNVKTLNFLDKNPRRRLARPEDLSSAVRAFQESVSLSQRRGLPAELSADAGKTFLINTLERRMDDEQTSG